MTRQHRTPPLETLRDAIAEALWGAVSAPTLPAACVALGLKDGDSTEAMHSKRKYVRNRITTLRGPELLALAHRVIEEYDVPDLGDFVSELTTHADQRVTDLTRRAILTELDSAGELFGDLPVWDGVAVLSPDLEKPSLYSDRFGAKLRDDILQHYVEDNDLSNFRLLDLCGALTCSQQRFFDLLEKVVDPVCRRGEAQERLVQALNKLLVADGFVLDVIGEISRHPQFGIRRVATGVAGAPKTLSLPPSIASRTCTSRMPSITTSPLRTIPTHSSTIAFFLTADSCGHRWQTGGESATNIVSWSRQTRACSGACGRPC